MSKIVAIKFQEAGKMYDFSSGSLILPLGEKVIVETDRGRAMGTVIVEPREVPPEDIPENVKSVIRAATEQDKASAQRYAARDDEAFSICKECVTSRNMEMKLVRAEHLFDGSKIVFYFTADGRIDFRELVKELAHRFHTRIEMRQIGVRDEAKLIGGMGICGRELCCSSFLREFEPVSVKMAKEQGLALNPSKISGQCGRLLCCLGYEYKTYCSLRKCLPKCGCKVDVHGQQGEVVNQNVLKQTVQVRLPDNKTVEWPEPKPKDKTDEDSFADISPRSQSGSKAQPDKKRQEVKVKNENSAGSKDEIKRKRRRPRKRKPSGSGEGSQASQKSQDQKQSQNQEKSQDKKQTRREDASQGNKQNNKPRNAQQQQQQKSGQPPANIDGSEKSKPRRRRPRKRKPNTPPGTAPNTPPKSDKE